MSRVRVKICGLNDAAGFDAAAANGADWIGFNFFSPSPRFVTPEQAAALSARAPGPTEGGPRRVGLFVDPDSATIAATLDRVQLDAVQLYSTVDAAALRSRHGVAVWRAVGVGTAEELPTAMDGADALVIEAKPPAGATRPGGNAASIDWAMLAGWRAPGDWLLAGGLTPGNVAAAIAASGAGAVDVSSGVERSLGRKDPALIAAFIRAALGEAKPPR